METYGLLSIWTLNTILKCRIQAHTNTRVAYAKQGTCVLFVLVIQFQVKYRWKWNLC